MQKLSEENQFFEEINHLKNLFPSSLLNELSLDSEDYIPEEMVNSAKKVRENSYSVASV